MPEVNSFCLLQQMPKVNWGAASTLISALVMNMKSKTPGNFIQENVQTITADGKVFRRQKAGVFDFIFGLPEEYLHVILGRGGQRGLKGVIHLVWITVHRNFY